MIHMKVGILGAGEVGSNLSKALVTAGHEVMLSSRNPDSQKMQKLIAEIGDKAQVGTVTETVAFGEVVVIAIGWGNGLEQVLTGISDWSGKVLVDATNRFGADFEGSAGERVARLTNVPVLKAFNSIGAEHYLDPLFNGIPASMIICGDDAAKERALSLVTDTGFEVIDLGGLDQCHLVESLGNIWVNLAFRRGYGRNIAFKIMQK